jgi:hypothetical protein
MPNLVELACTWLLANLPEPFDADGSRAGVNLGGYLKNCRCQSHGGFSPRLCEATMLEERVSDHGHQRVTMKTLPRSSLTMRKLRKSKK